MKSLPPLSLTVDETRAVANAIRALGRHLESDRSDPEWERIERRLLRVWERPEIQEVLRGRTFAEEAEMIGFALRYLKLDRKATGSELQKKSAAKKHENRVTRDRAICQEFLRWKRKPGKSRLSPETFREELGEHGEHLPNRLRFFKKSLYPNGRRLSRQQFRNILRPVLAAK